MKENNFYLIGCASGIAGADIHSGDGPLQMQGSRYLAHYQPAGVSYNWKDMVVITSVNGQRKDEAVAKGCQQLANIISPLVTSAQPFCVVGGDHSCAVGTWSGVYDAMREKGDIGLIWIDAHMDSHTPETSPSDNIHGMPLACLLGYGYPTLTGLLYTEPKFKPENVCLIGVRSFESGEEALLKRLNVRVYFMEEVTRRGLPEVMREAVSHVNRYTVGYGVTIDIDSVDPEDAPGVDVPEENGLHGQELCEVIKEIADDHRLIATEVVEFDPLHDKQDRTEILIAKLISIIAEGAVRR